MKDVWKLDIKNVLPGTLEVIVMEVDGRGAQGRGLAWEELLFENIGDYDVNDQLRALQFIVEEYNIDKNRIGVLGDGYGGYLGLQMMLDKRHGGDIISCAVLRSPIAEWSWHGNFNEHEIKKIEQYFTKTNKNDTFM